MFRYIFTRIKQIISNRRLMLDLSLQYKYGKQNIDGIKGVVKQKFVVNSQLITIHYRYISFGDRISLMQVFNHGHYNLTEGTHNDALNKYYADLVKPLIIDAGANIGASILYFNASYPTCKIVALEPELNNIKMCKKNICELKNVQLLEQGLNNDEGVMYLIDPGLSDNAFRTLSQSSDSSYPVITTSINSILLKNSAFTPFIIKIDIEGTENSLFDRNTEWIEQIPLIIVETHDRFAPGEGVSQNLFREMLRYDFDTLIAGDNLLFYNNKLLSKYYL